LNTEEFVLETKSGPNSGEKRNNLAEPASTSWTKTGVRINAGDGLSISKLTTSWTIQSLAEMDTFDLDTKHCLIAPPCFLLQPFTARAEAHSCRLLKKSVDGDKADNLNTMMVETTDATRMSSLSLRYTKKFGEKSMLEKFEEDVHLLCRVEKFLRRYINGDSCFMPTMYAQRLQGREGAGDGTVIIIVRIKEVGESENCVSCFRRGAVATEGEGHQKREAQSVNPSIESSKTNYFGEEGHQKHEAQSVNSPVRYNKVCYSPHLHPDTRRDPRSSVAETEYSEEDEMGKSAKVDAIQHSYLGPEIADALGTQHQVIRFDTKQLLHREDAQCCVVESQHVHSGRKQDRDLVQEDDSDCRATETSRTINHRSVCQQR